MLDTGYNGFMLMADAHIRSRTWTNFSRVSGDAWAALRKLSAGMATGYGTNRRKILVIAGDWFDSNRPSSRDALESSEFLKNFDRVLYVRGNHDTAVPGWAEATGAVTHVTELTDDPVELPDGSFVFGLSWSLGREAMLDGLKRISAKMTACRSESTCYIVVHAAFRHLLGFDGKWQLELADIDRLFPLFTKRVVVLAGDIHVRDTSRTPGGAVVHSPGPLFPQNWEQTQRRCFVSLVNGMEISDIPADVREYAQVEASSTEELDRALATVARRPDMLPPLVRVSIPAGCDWNPPERDGFVLQAVCAEEAAAHAAAPAATPGLGLADAVEAELSDQDLKDMSGALMASDDPLAELEGWFASWNLPRIQ